VALVMRVSNVYSSWGAGTCQLGWATCLRYLFPAPFEGAML
jgi:hypothetical protein